MAQKGNIIGVTNHDRLHEFSCMPCTRYTVGVVMATVGKAQNEAIWQEDNVQRELHATFAAGCGAGAARIAATVCLLCRRPGMLMTFMASLLQTPPLRRKVAV